MNDDPAAFQVSAGIVPLAWWSGSLADFCAQEDASIAEHLAFKAIERHMLNHEQQLRAWLKQIDILRSITCKMPRHWRLLFEYPLLRLERRLDAVLVTEYGIFVFEFKIGSVLFDAAAKRQAEDYALDLHYFHSESANATIIPILVASDAKAPEPLWPLVWHGVINPIFLASAASLNDLVGGILPRLPSQNVDVVAWEHAPYRPIPTIVEAATLLYRKHGVDEIRAARADIGNLTLTTSVIRRAVEEARRDRCYIVVFVTGIPGAGKTLCGLDAVFGADTGAAFLTGNIPLVHVLREALAQDAANGDKKKINETRRRTKTAVQGLMGFIEENINSAVPPHEHVIVFDEAQRAWDAVFGKKRFQRNDSEAAIFLDIMRKHEDYAVVIALVGNGQEINTGEAGLQEWGRALAKRPEWQIRAACDVLTAIEPRQRLFPTAPKNLSIDPSLHLDVSVRSISSSATALWVAAVLQGKQDEAKAIARDGVAFFVTRSLSAMRAGLRVRARGERRAGLVCSTGAKRLVADGIWPDFPHLDKDAVANWFLKSWPADVRASDALEVPATQFACQGLELDYVGLCWGGDLVWNGSWKIRMFSGTKWQNPSSQDAKDFRLNTYRVLLTRARYETIIWMPAGDASDPTREPELFDGTAEYLIRCGATLLKESTSDSKPDEAERLLL